jgi:hypothetical protein
MMDHLEVSPAKAFVCTEWTNYEGCLFKSYCSDLMYMLEWSQSLRTLFYGRRSLLSPSGLGRSRL